MGAPLRRVNIEVFGIITFGFDAKYVLWLTKLRYKPDGKIGTQKLWLKGKTKFRLEFN